jgi:hypothetical protein
MLGFRAQSGDGRLEAGSLEGKEKEKEGGFACKQTYHTVLAVKTGRRAFAA